MIFGMWDSVLFHLGPIPVDHLVVTQWAVVLVLGLFAFMGSRNMQVIPRGMQNGLEMVVEFTYNFFGQVMDEEHIAKKYAPLLSTFFLFIICSNYSGLIPGASHIQGFQPPTSNWNVTATLALITALTVHYAGFSEHGAHYLGHFISPNPAFLPLNLLEEIAHPLSLTVRLFGNIFGEEMIIAYLMFLAPFFVPTALMGLSVMLGAIQAIVFTLLSASYIAASSGGGH